tara:strand:- start:657 stop:887 length:231 start_codon:yes stop_codon:yes gene_type:complete
MNNFFKNLKFLFFIFSSSLSFPAYAYLDPGTGSMVLQALIGGIAVSVSFISLYWQKVKAFFGKEKSAIEPDSVDKD